MQQVGVVKPVMPSGCSELLALRYFGIGIRFDEIRSAIGREAKVDACVSVEPQGSVNAFRCSLNAGGHLRRKGQTRSQQERVGIEDGPAKNLLFPVEAGHDHAQSRSDTHFKPPPTSDPSRPLYHQQTAALVN
jgi:hypothetical protein